MENLLSGMEVERVSNAVAAGQGTTNTTGVAIDNLEGVMFVASIGAIVGGGTVDMKLQGSDDDGSGDPYSDLEGTAATQLDDTGDNKLLVIEIKRPRKRFVRAVIVTATANGTIDSVVAYKYGKSKMPVVQGATVGSLEIHASPKEGTA